MEIKSLDKVMDTLYRAMQRIQTDGVTVKKDTIVAHTAHQFDPDVLANDILLAMIELRDLKKEIIKLTSV